jgi:tetratricopeptide (TPR) repeat protein
MKMKWIQMKGENSREDELVFARRSLDDLEEELLVGEIKNEDYEHLKAKYERRLKRLEKQDRDDDPVSSIENQDVPKVAPKKRNAASRRMLLIGSVIVCAAALMFWVVQSAETRSSVDGLTGGNSSSTQQLLLKARSLLGSDRVQAREHFQRVLLVEPDNLEARTYVAWIDRLETREKLASGTLSADESRAQFLDIRNRLEQVTELSSQYADPRCFQAVIDIRDLQDPLAALGSYRACVSANPNQTTQALVSAVGPDIDAALVGNADPVVAGLAKARQARDRFDVKEAIVAYEKVREIDPNNAEAGTWSSWLVARGVFTLLDAQQIPEDMAKNRLRSTEETIDRIRATFPQYADAGCVKVVLAAQRQDEPQQKEALPACRTGVATPEIRDAAMSLSVTEQPEVATTS